MRILIIEDETGIIDFLKQGLEEEGFEIDVALDGQTGLHMAMHQPYDVLLIDWMLPKLTGLAVCKSYREAGFKTPVIFLTARDTVQDAIAGLKAGANDYIRKPFHFEELLERIRTQVRHYDNTTVLALGPVSLNPEKHQVFYNDREVALTQREFALLEYLLRNKGKVCRRDRIMDVIWGADAVQDTGVIDVHMNALRRKLHLQPDAGLIQTIRGVGFIAKEE
ncbi:MAG: response regulator transcription factor [Cyclobacteriaceae bacterium]